MTLWDGVLCTESLLVVALVNSFYMFVDASVGYPGRAGDNTAQERDFHGQSCSWPHCMAWGGWGYLGRWGCKQWEEAVLESHSSAIL
eukprot:6182654-Pleurochrysis_carterae.AAC.1